jgi:hypothetical protein
VAIRLLNTEKAGEETLMQAISQPTICAKIMRLHSSGVEPSADRPRSEHPTKANKSDD